jgi:penicillin-binding protein 2
MARNEALKDTYSEKRLYQSRTVAVLFIVVALLSALVWRYFTLQITQHDIYKTQSERNRVQLQSIAPKRGLIYDRNGVLLAENRASYSLTIVREQVDDFDETIALLRQLIDISDEHIEKFQRLYTRRKPYAAVPLKLNLTEDEIATISVNRYRLPGVDIDAQLARYYPQGELFAHALGYVGRINEVEQFDLDPVNYSATNQVGKIGLEKFYEQELHGTVGYQNVETNARGRVLRVLERTDPEPGADITLYMDAYVQKAAYEALGDQRGAVVAIDPNTGGIIAMVSTPSFDANLFVNGISSRDYNALRNSPDLPLFNRALQGQYPPASTIKPVYGLAGLHYGLITPQTRIKDPGWYQIPNDERRYRDWTLKTRQGGHAESVDLEMSIVESCDTYFYDLAFRMGIDRIYEFLSPFGLGEKTGVDNTNERSGLLPSREWKRRAKNLPWFPGETVNIGIGQGYLLATPLQLASVTATMAARGKHYRPKLLKRLGDDDVAVDRLPDIEVADEHWDAVIEAMKLVVHGAKGTATRINRGLEYRMAGKTGTAQVIGIAQGEKYDAETISKRNLDHGLFIAFAPVENPKIAVAVVVENGEHGTTIAPIARKVIDAYLIDQNMLNDDVELDSIESVAVIHND